MTVARMRNVYYSKLRVLIVADSRTMKIVLKDLLVTIGFSKENLEFAIDGESALSMAERKIFDLIISNIWMLSPMNGLELLEKVRRHENMQVRETPFLFITGERRSEYFQEAMDKGADGYLAKPFKILRLEKELEKIFKPPKAESAEMEARQVGASLGSGLTKLRDPDLAGSSVLIVDDSEANISLLKKALSGYGIEFQEASSGEAALKLLENSIPDLIILDIILPGIDGFETCRKIKANKNTRGVPVIFITSKTGADDILTGFSLGGADYIAKPFRKEEALFRVVNQLHLAKALKEKEKLISSLLDLTDKKEILIEELMALKEKLEVYANRDSLTGLLNRRGMNERIEIEVARFVRNKNPFILIMGDIDHFKKVNDTYGHEAGDHVLVEISKILMRSLRRQDSIARWGGEEFLILLPETDIDGGLAVTEKFRKEVEAENFSFEKNRVSFTISFGLCVYNNREIDIDQCLKQADDYLYQAKKAGRNRIFCGQIN